MSEYKSYLTDFTPFFSFTATDGAVRIETCHSAHSLSKVHVLHFVAIARVCAQDSQFMKSGKCMGSEGSHHWFLGHPLCARSTSPPSCC